MKKATIIRQYSNTGKTVYEYVRIEQDGRHFNLDLDVRKNNPDPNVNYKGLEERVSVDPEHYKEDFKMFNTLND